MKFKSKFNTPEIIDDEVESSDFKPVQYATDYIKDFIPKVKSNDINKNRFAFEKWLYNKGALSFVKNKEYTTEVKMRYLLANVNDVSFFISDQKLKELNNQVGKDIIDNVLGYYDTLNSILSHNHILNTAQKDYESFLNFGPEDEEEGNELDNVSEHIVDIVDDSSESVNKTFLDESDEIPVNVNDKIDDSESEPDIDYTQDPYAAEYISFYSDESDPISESEDKLVDKICEISYLASDCVHQGEYEKAIGYCEYLISVDPDEDYHWINKGVSHQELEQYDDAIKCYDKAIELNPDDDLALNLKDELLHNLEKESNNDVVFDNGLDKVIYFIIATEEYEGGIEWFNKKLKLNSDPSFPNHLLKCFKKYLKFDSKDSILWSYLGNVFLNINEFEKSLECCDNARASDYNNSDAWFITGKIFYKLNKYNRAIKYATKAKQLNPDDSDIEKFIEKVKEKQFYGTMISYNTSLDDFKSVPEDLETDYESIAEELENESWYKNPLRYGTDVFKDTYPNKIKFEDVNNNLEAFEKWMFHNNIISLTKNTDNDDITEEVKMKYISSDDIKLPKLTKDDLNRLNYNERAKYYHCKQNIPLLEKWLDDNPKASSEKIDKKNKRLNYFYDKISELISKASGDTVSVSSDGEVHFYFSCKQHCRVMDGIMEEIKKTSYDKMLKKILSFKDVNVVESSEGILNVQKWLINNYPNYDWSKLNYFELESTLIGFDVVIPVDKKTDIKIDPLRIMSNGRLITVKYCKINKKNLKVVLNDIDNYDDIVKWQKDNSCLIHR